MFTKKILAAAITSQPSASGVADAIDFDGATDYLSRASDLAGNADGKTFTFSAWFYPKSDTGSVYCASIDTVAATASFTVNAASGAFQIQARNSSGTSILVVSGSAATFLGFAHNTLNHILVSVDLANTSNRSIYLNDVLQNPTWTTYTNDVIDFTQAVHFVGKRHDGALHQERIAHVYLDKQYRDLSVEANRRLFITADRKPALNQQALNPILYLPLSDPTQPGKNLGTGGDFTLNGVVARSGRGPSQFNAPYSDLDGSADYLSRTSLTGIADSKLVTCAFAISPSSVASRTQLSFDGNKFSIGINASGQFVIKGANAAGASILSATVTSPIAVIGRNYVVALSADMANASNRAVTVNGVAATVTWTTYTDDAIDFTNAAYNIGRLTTATEYTQGKLGNVFFDTKYIDLSQPANLAKFVTGTGIDAKPADLGANGEKPFGTPPLIYLPMYGNNAGKNYGTGGDFTVNSGPFPGARGPNEFWGNKADFDGSTGYLARTSALSGVSDGKTFSCSFFFTPDAININQTLFAIDKLSLNEIKLNISIDSNNALKVIGKNSSNTEILSIKSDNGNFTTNTQYACHVCIDLTDPSKRFIYIQNNPRSLTVTTYTNDTIVFSEARATVGSRYTTLYTELLNGKLSEFYFTTEYIDFSQEANRLKFRDAFGNPVDLALQIAAGTLPNPAIYMRFDPANFGKNSGTGGDFVVNGTITDGGQL